LRWGTWVRRIKILREYYQAGEPYTGVPLARFDDWEALGCWLSAAGKTGFGIGKVAVPEA